MTQIKNYENHEEKSEATRSAASASTASLAFRILAKQFCLSDIQSGMRLPDSDAEV